MEFKTYCGLDIHKDKYVACLLDKQGKELRKGNFPSTKEALGQFLSGIDNTSCVIIIENCGMWRFAYKIIKKLGFHVKLANGTKTNKVVGHKKTDQEDAKVLANLARTNYLDELYIPNDEILKLRDLTHHLHGIRNIIIMYKNKIKGELIKNGIKYNPKIWNSLGLHWLNTLKIPSITSLVKLLQQIQVEEKLLHKEVIKVAKQIKQTRLLMTIPGIAEYLSLIIYSEIGDIKRFNSPKKLTMYSGLCPGIHQTGNVERQVRNYMCNKFLKYAFTLSSGRAMMLKNNIFYTMYEKYKKKKGMPTARRIIARNQLTIVWNMLTKNEVFRA